ncbi:MAG: ATP-binding protein [Bacteroidota bacterium]
MKQLEKTSNLVETLQGFEVFEGIKKEPLEWIVEHSNYVCFEKGENLFYPGMETNYMQIIVSGKYVIYLERDGQKRETGVWGTGYITGVLPFSRMKIAKAYGRALENCCVLQLHKKHFIEMVQVSYELVQNLVGAMSSRIREFSQLRFQDEKLMALGKLSAGLAHELNNPASAMVRSAEELYKKIHQTPEKFKSVITMKISPEQTDQINEILFNRIENREEKELSLLEKQDLEADLEDWLDEYEIEDAEDIVETFVDFQIKADDLERVAAILGNEEAIPTIMWWLESTMSLEVLVNEIRESANRISELVGSVKNYSHMDRSTSMEATDVREGIKNTLMMLKHKLKKQQIEVQKNCTIDLPMVMAYGGQLNQVWTNIIDNAIDAMPDGGTLKIDIFSERSNVCINIIDSGTGIPEEKLTRIFEPFYTTKPMGEGTGMGLDITRKIIDRHKGRIDVESEPGETVFKICFPESSRNASNHVSKRPKL